MKNNNFFLLFLLPFFLVSCTDKEPGIIMIDGSNGVRPLVDALAADFMKTEPGFQLSIAAGMSGKERIAALQNDSIDIAMASHGLDIEALEKEGYSVILFAKMPVVMAVNEKVGIDGLSSQQICDIYSGGFSNWKELGGNTVQIMPISRPFEEVDVEVIIEHIPCFSQIRVDEYVRFEEKSGDLAKVLAVTDGGIGMTTLTRVNQSKGAFQAIAIDGISPSLENTLSGRYALTRNSFLVVKKDHSKRIQQFLSYIISEQGRKVLEANEAVPVFGE
jgi:phosphate transport system substrate-binding protein